MPRRLSNLEWVTFINDMNPDSMNLPRWGGVAKWGDQYILMCKLPNPDPTLPQEWALSDITDGIPWGNPPNQTVVDVKAYVGQIPGQDVNETDIFWGSLPANFMAVALERAADAAALASETIVWTSEQVSKAVAPIIQAAVPALWPLALAAVAVLFILEGRR